MAARTDNAEFLEPLIGTWPESLEPPAMVKVGSVRVWGGVCGREKRGDCCCISMKWGFGGLRPQKLKGDEAMGTRLGNLSRFLEPNSNSCTLLVDF